MARPQSPRYPHLDATRSRLRSKECVFALLAGILVLAFVFHSRLEGGLIPSASAPEVLSNEIPSTSDQEPVPIAPLRNGEETGPKIVSPGHDEDAASTTGSNSNAGISASDSSSSSNAGTGTAVGTTSSSSSSKNPSTAGSTAPAADRPLAVIIETTMISNLIPLMLHFSTVLGPSWGMVLFTLQENWVEPLSPAFQRRLASGRIEVRFLPAGTALTNSQSVSRFLTSPWLWEQTAAAKRILLFQTDSVLCSRSESAVEDYFQYDFAGAPIAAQYGSGYNGGLSVRNPRLFLQIVRETDFATSGIEFEDQFFYKELLRREAAMPGQDEAKTFAVETIYYETPLGYHQPQRWQKDNMAAIEEWCPEVKLLIGRRAQ